MELCIIFLCLFISFIKICHGQGDLPNVQPHSSQAKLAPSVCRKDANGTSLSVEILLPFMDMELRHERPMHVLRTEHLLLVLHGHELFQLHMGSVDKRLVRLGELTGRVQQQASIGAAVASWREYLLLAVGLPESLEFYQLPQEALLNGIQLHFEPIQEFALGGSLQQLQLLKPNQEQVLLLVTSNMTQSQARCRTYEWLESYFNPVEELNLPAIKAFQVVGRQPHYLVTGRSLRGQTKLVLTIYELLTPSLRLQRRQSLTVQARQVLAVRFRGRNFLFACGSASASAAATCILFRMVEGNFVVYRKHMLQQLQFSQLAASELGQLLVGARANGEVLVFNSHRLDCYSGFGADANPSGVYMHRNPKNESFILLAYQRNSSTTLLRMVQLGAIPLTTSTEGSNDDQTLVQQHRHEFEEAIGELRGLLLRRRHQMEEVRRLTKLLLQQESTLNLEKPLHLGSGSTVEQVHLQGPHLATPTQLQRRMEQLRQKYAAVPRMSRSFGVGNESHSAAEETLKVRRLHVQNLIYHGELMPGYYVDSSGPPILTIKGKLLSKQLHTEQLVTPQGYKPPERTENPNHLVVRHLQVERINNVSWTDFYDKLFLRSRDTEIEGRLVIQSRARVVNLQTTLLNGLVVQQLFNLRQPQVVASNIFMSAFFVSSLDANLINGLNFAKDVVFRGANNTLIKTPVRINQMSVSGNIIVANDTKWERQMSSELPQSPLQQYYTGRVTINGTLTVNNLLSDTNATRLQLGGQSLRVEDLHADYLLLHTPQNLTSLVFGNAKVTMPSLSTSHIRGHPIAEHLLSGAGHQAVAGHKRLHLIFMNVSVDGDIKCSHYTSRLAHLSRDAVRHGETATITGHKRFEAPLTVDSLKTQSLNGVPVSELVLKTQLEQNFTGLKQFARIVVKKNVEVTRNLNAKELNRRPLAQLLQPAYSLQRLELLEMPQLDNLIFQRLNGLPFDELLGKLSVGSEDQLLLKKKLIIEGNVRFERDVQLQSLNGVNWQDYMQRLVKANENSLITGSKSFLEPVVITDALHSPTINGLDLSALLENTLLRTTPQAISGDYSFQSMTASNVDVPLLNQIPASRFLDTRRKSLHLRGDLYVQDLIINGSFSCSFDNDPLPQLSERLAALRQRPWRRLMVLQDALWPQSSTVPPSPQQQQLDYLRQHAVRRRGDPQVISGHVILHQPKLGKMQTRQSFPPNLNITHLAEDAVLRQGPGIQHITASLEMLQSVRARSVTTLQDAQFELLNDIDVIRLNASLYRRSSGLPIEAHLHFQTPPILGKLLLQGKLNGLPTDSIFQQSAEAVWPPVMMRHLHLERDLQLDEINGMNLEYLLQNRVPLRGAPLEVFGTLHFEQLQLGKNALLRSINGIPLQNVVYKNGQQAQAISGVKTFDGGIDLEGPAHVLRLNGHELSESYQSTIFTDRNYSIDSLLLDAAEFQGGLLPDVDVGESRQATQLPQDDAYDELVQQVEQLEQQLQQQPNCSQRLHYLDYEPALEVTWSEPLANETFDLVANYTPPADSVCQQQQLRAQLSHRRQLVYLSKLTLPSHVLLLNGNQTALSIRAQNNCNQTQLLPRSRSRIQVSCGGDAHTLGLPHHVEDLKLLELREYSLLLIATFEELRILRVNHSNCSLSDWQSLPSNGQLMQLLQLESKTTLLVNSALHQDLPVVAVHRLNAGSQRFELLQYIDGDYDLAALQREQLLLSCYSCRHIAFYVYNEMMQQLVELQQLRLDSHIQQLLTFTVAQEQLLLVLTTAGSKYYYLFSYAHIAGWQQRTYGHMTEFQWSWPLLRAGQELTASTPILLLCGQRQCSLVQALLH